ncbi:hypothetical protein F01_470003 [Burkholderia cenocepacia]|nr:hypothetical protein F01_470003 [Burkholderia cenocepacia]
MSKNCYGSYSTDYRHENIPNISNQTPAAIGNFVLSEHVTDAPYPSNQPVQSE